MNEKVTDPLLASTIQAMRTPTLKDQILNHPALPVASYCIASIMMTVVNKVSALAWFGVDPPTARTGAVSTPSHRAQADPLSRWAPQFVVSGSHFNMNFLLLTIQSSICCICVATCKHLGFLTFRTLSFEDARKWFPISFLLVMVIYSGSKSLQYLPVSVYTIFKNLTIILIAYGETIWFGTQITPLTLVSFGIMVFSSILAAAGDIARAVAGESLAKSGQAAPGVGYLWMAINCFVSAGYVLAMRKRIKITNFTDWETMFANNLLSVPVLILFSVTLEDWSGASLALNFPAATRTTLLGAMAFSGAAAVGISYCTAWCVRTTSSTTFSMVGALNKLPIAASGILFFNDPATFSSVAAILLGFVSGLVYSAAKAAQTAKAKLAAATDAPRN